MYTPETHKGDGVLNFGRKRRKKQICSKKKHILGEFFLKMVNGAPGPSQAGGAVFKLKIESQHIEFIFSKIVIFYGHFPGVSINNLDEDDP